MAVTNNNTGKVSYLTLAFILIVAGVIIHGHKEFINSKNAALESAYDAQLSYYQTNNVYYEPRATIKWLSARQHPKGYFVENPDSMNEPSQLNKNTLQATRHAILSLYALDGLWDINQKSTIEFVKSLYQPKVLINNQEVSGFHSMPGEPLGLRPTMDALITLLRLNALNEQNVDLNKIKAFILNHQNPDGGFWDPYYSGSDKRSCLKCTSFALSALGIINSITNENYPLEFKNQIVKYVQSTWSNRHQTYTSAATDERHDSFDIFRAYLSLSSLSSGSIEQRIRFGRAHFKVEEQLDTIENYFTADNGAFTTYPGSNTPSMKATHLMIWIFTDLELLDKVDQKGIINFVLSNQTSPGEYGGDIYNTYSATRILKRLEVSTRALVKPEPPKYHQSIVPDFLPYLLYLLSMSSVLFYYLKNKKILESKTEVLESKVKYDSLTGVYSRDFFEDGFKDFVQHRDDLSLILVDIDHFKAINDKYGHLIGDRVLQAVAELISSSVRKQDLLARWGGEEFAILCPDTSLDSAKTLAEKLRLSIESEDFEHIKTLSCSFGVSHHLQNESLSSLFERADKAMYLSKETGRNKVSTL